MDRQTAMNIEEVKATIGRGNQIAGQAQATMADVGDRIGDAGGLVGVTRGSEHMKVRLGRERLKEARAEAQRVFDLLGSGTRAADEFGRALG
jgi:hypothetical protein